ncbi:MAG TPA: hypothetical protein PLR76_03355 [Hyphomonas sp.]|nr:hypothetical protein [Hyphomonas sp.]
MLEAFEDRSQNAVKIFQQMSIPEANNFPAFIPKKCSSLGIVRFLGIIAMTVAIQFNDQPHFEAGEVRKERTNGMLTPELPASELAAAQF